MRRAIAIIAALAVLALILLLAACEKEKVVESTEYIHDIEYLELPGDTIYRVDTVFSQNSDTTQNTDTVIVSDTVVQDNYIYDTVQVNDTVLVYDTVVTVDEHYDTVVVTDTLQIVQCNPTEALAVTAMQYYCNPLVIQVINQEFGLNDGWIFYLSSYQLDLTRQSSDVYDMYGFIDYWTPDWTGFYPFEFYWRMVYTGGDPADPDNWEMTEPPSSMSNHLPGVSLSRDGAAAQRTLR